MPYEPSISISGTAEIGQADADVLDFDYKRAVSGTAEIGQSDADVLDFDYKRAISGTLHTGTATLEAIALTKTAVSGEIETGVAGVRVDAAVKVAAMGEADIGRAATWLRTTKKISVMGIGESGGALIGLSPLPARNIDGTAELGDRTLVRLNQVIRKIVPPPPKFEITVQEASGEVPLQGATLCRGSSYRLNVKGRGYHLNTLRLARGPKLDFWAVSGETIAFSKSTHQPLGGIGIDSVTPISTTTFGDLEEAIAQIRIYPTDTERLNSGVYAFRLQFIDPLSERPEPLRGTFYVG